MRPNDGYSTSVQLHANQMEQSQCFGRCQAGDIITDILQNIALRRPIYFQNIIDNLDNISRLEDPVNMSVEFAK